MQKMRIWFRKQLSYHFHDREQGLQAELAFWEEWLDTQALGHLEEYNYRLSPDAPVLGFPERLLLKIEHETISILDVGSGPLTTIGKNYPGKQILLTAVDPLADQYRQILKRREITPPVWSLQCAGEELSSYFGPDRFDLVYAENSLDHTTDPLKIIREMITVCKPGGVIGLAHRNKEGEQQNYRDLHQWNFYLRKGKLILSGKRYMVQVNRSLRPFQFESEDREGFIFSWGKKNVIA